MGRRTATTYGGSRALFIGTLTTAQKLAQARGWLEDTEAALAEAMRTQDQDAIRRERRRRVKEQAVVRALEICERTGKEFTGFERTATCKS